jgi:hypothetical protein
MSKNVNDTETGQTKDFGRNNKCGRGNTKSGAVSQLTVPGLDKQPIK